MKFSQKYPQPDYYEIRAQGHFDPAWMDWFDGFTITTVESGEVILYGPVPDQSALHGLIGYLKNIDLTLISIKRLKTEGNT